MTRSELVVFLARAFDFVREAQSIGQNRGQRVEAIQHWAGGITGESWCMDFATTVLDLAFKGKAPILRQGNCQAVYDLARANGWLAETPSVGDLFLYVDEHDHAHHVGIVTAVDPLTAIAGNTSALGTSSNGDGVYEHAIDARVFIAYPRDDAA